MLPAEAGWPPAARVDSEMARMAMQRVRVFMGAPVRWPRVVSRGSMYRRRCPGPQTVFVSVCPLGGLAVHISLKSGKLRGLYGG